MAFGFNKMFGGGSSDEYVEIDLNSAVAEDKRVLVKFFVLKQFDDEEVNTILNALREGNSIAIIDIRGIRSKDPIELKRAISKIKKTVDAVEGSIAGFGENVIVATPKFAEIHKAPQPKKEKADFIHDY